MGLFKALTDIIRVPLNVVEDVVELPKKIIDGDNNLMEHTSENLEDIAESLED